MRHVGRGDDVLWTPPREHDDLAGTGSERALIASDEPYFDDQWHLDLSLGFDINIDAIWPDYKGSGISVVVLDTGIQLSHPDLDGNIDAVNQIDSEDNQTGAGEGAPKDSSDNHGTNSIRVVNVNVDDLSSGSFTF